MQDLGETFGGSPLKSPDKQLSTCVTVTGASIPSIAAGFVIYEASSKQPAMSVSSGAKRGSAY